jgi:hypothetical protein
MYAQEQVLHEYDLQGEQEREVVRVTLDCALHEEG